MNLGTIIIILFALWIVFFVIRNIYLHKLAVILKENNINYNKRHLFFRPINTFNRFFSVLPNEDKAKYFDIFKRAKIISRITWIYAVVYVFIIAVILLLIIIFVFVMTSHKDTTNIIEFKEHNSRIDIQSANYISTFCYNKRKVLSPKPLNSELLTTIQQTEKINRDYKKLGYTKTFY